MRAIMYRCNFDRTSISLYLQAGLLPRIIQASHDRYIALLYKARQKVIEHGSWDDSLGYEMILHHARETQNIRQYSVDWRNFVIQTYVYLRDAERKSYVDETMYESLFKRHSVTPSAGTPSNNKRDGASTCSHCRCPVGTAHPGGKGTCVFGALSYLKAREAGQKFVQALEASPNMDKAKKVKELIDAAGAK